jgi:signal recognition particle receptor subunit beta
MILYFIDSTREGGEEEKYIKELISKASIPVVKIYTKCDLPPKITIPE